MENETLEVLIRQKMKQNQRNMGLIEAFLCSYEACMANRGA